ncbi:MAG: hypothetical protein L0212_07030 [Acidobacteria bacterium]|nr:hypothetical protein [Acidobacteriota bacterium]
MKAWIRQPNGTYKIEGRVTTRQVRLEILRPGRKPGFSLHDRTRIEAVILDAIATGHASARPIRSDRERPAGDGRLCEGRPSS